MAFFSQVIRWIGCSCLLVGLQGCVNAYDPSLTLNANLIVVSGIITDLNETQTISLSRSRSSVDSLNVTIPIQRAIVTVTVNGTTPISLVEAQPGIYQFPADFRGKVGNSYQLHFQTSEGTVYESSVETMASVPAIQRTYDQFNPQGPKKTADGLPIPANDIYLDMQDPADGRNFYLWRWRLYEIQLWCATCQQGRYVVRDIGPVGAGPIDIIGCIRDTTVGTTNLFDYPCRGLCWDIFHNTDVDVFSDVYTNGQAQVGHKVASIPIYQRDPALIVVEQLSISANAYRYYRLFADQVQNTGTLADSPPAPISGNIRNVNNSSENVVGYFSAASVAVSRHKISRQSVNTGMFQGLFYAINGRAPRLETSQPGSSPFGSTASSALCIPNNSRTDQVPPGWNE
ncbi:DUF4249 domain-containing protein [Spirosoma pollinicola]|uniref:DUF4249 domain-containing protein n=1 Tax=Spirosoma pollinicola TaxID=2057025 RepID=A0A2K8YS94_9BACT|nr:DUF4249 domain-containing protein [Spirosoma pollinicola]AUD00480.1 hypothetical protein CWM47_00770 [Spirosoma pollinicola]